VPRHRTPTNSSSNASSSGADRKSIRALPRAHRAAARTCPLRDDAARRAALGCRPDPPRTPRQHLKPMRRASSPTPAASRVTNSGSIGVDA